MHILVGGERFVLFLYFVYIYFMRVRRFFLTAAALLNFLCCLYIFRRWEKGIGYFSFYVRCERFSLFLLPPLSVELFSGGGGGRCLSRGGGEFEMFECHFGTDFDYRSSRGEVELFVFVRGFRSKYLVLKGYSIFIHAFEDWGFFRGTKRNVI